MAQNKARIDVMVSSTTNDLGEHRRRVAEVVTKFRFVPRIMDLDSTTGKDGVTYSLDLVDEAEIYILLLGFRYGYVPDDPRNPKQISMTQMEYERALEREARGELCVLPFVMSDDHLLMHDHIEIEPEKRRKLDIFRAQVLNKQIGFFRDIDDLEKQVMQSLATSPCVKALETSNRSITNFNPRKGEVLNARYTFEEKLGQGGNGEVWKAQEHLTDGSLMNVAIKLLKPEISDNPSRIERFKKEIAVTRRLRHPHIILTTTDGMVGEQFYAVMDYIQGETLREFIKGRQFSIEDTVRYLGQIAEALQAAHKQKVVHRDVKPENILVRGDKLYLGDFGLAVSPDEDMSVTATGELVGTKKYMSPEQWDNQATTAQTDIYALALITYEMLTGEYPYDASSHPRLWAQHLNEQLPEHPQLAHEILAILRRATAKTPENRHETAIDFIVDLSHWQLDPENIQTRMSKYLETVGKRLKGDVYEKLFVDLEGDIRDIIQQVEADTSADDAYHDPMFSEFDELLDEFMVELDADHHQAQSTESDYVPNIIEQLLNSERVVLVGEPGSGKSFTLRRLVMRYIREYDQHQRVPIFVPLNAFKGETDFVAYIKQQMGELSPYYEQLRDNKQLVLICDALNEMPRTPSTDERDLVNEVREELANLPYFVVSCRVRDYKNDLNSLKLERLEVRDLDLPAIREFVQRYKLLLKYDADELWQKMGGSEGLFRFWQAIKDKNDAEIFWQEDSSIPSYTDVSDDNDWRKMWTGAKLIPLSRNPYMARVICGLHGRDEMPSNRAELYQAFVADLYEGCA